jgi:drug/metabolite transporter (DMT)-like permease
LVVGFMGVALLARGYGDHSSAAHNWGVVALLVASMSWALGSIFGRHAHKPSSPLLGVAMQMIAGGTLLLGMAILRGEASQFSFGQVTLLSAGSWLYLTVAGSLVGYTCYVWLLHATTPARVATYAYVNPFIAVLLGCTIGREAFSHELVLAGGLIIAAVVLIVRGGPRQAAAETPSEEVG